MRLNRQEKTRVHKAFQHFQKGQQRNFQPGIFYKAFLRPFQAILKTWETTSLVQKIGCLPFGLRQVTRKSISGNAYTLNDFNSISQLPDHLQNNYSEICSQSYDNMISLMKRHTKEELPVDESSINLRSQKQVNSLDVAICIAMYSEDSLMLNKTLNGVKKNISHFIDEEVSADRIGVFVIMDGIQHVHKSLEKFYQELENENQMFFNEKRNQNNSVHDFFYDGQIDNDDEGIQNGEMAFTDQEFNDLFSRRFTSRKAEYIGVKKVLKEIEDLEKQKSVNFDSISVKLQEYFIEKAKKYHKNLYAEDDEEIQKKTTEYFIQHYVGNNEVYQKLIREALSEAKKQSLIYFEKREKMALVNTFRVQLDKKIRNKKKKEEKKKQQKDQNQEEQSEDEQGQIDQEESQKFISPQQFKKARSKKRFMNLFMVTKYKNGGKLSSHNWFFNGFCRELGAKYAILLDVGLMPGQKALVKMYKHMENNKKVGGVCGYMAVRREAVEEEEQSDCFTSFFQNTFDIQKAQEMEYHYSHLVDKPFESIFKFVHVLPGAFSGYRMKALQPNKDEDSTLLQEYFKSLNTNHSSSSSTTFTLVQLIFKILLPQYFYEKCWPVEPNSTEQILYNENVYLAEDRTLCMGIHLNGYHLQYLPDAYSEVDPMKTVSGLLGQRKRWINGSFFAFEQVKNTHKEKTTYSCTCCSCRCLSLQIIFLSILNNLVYFAPSLFATTIYMSIESVIRHTIEKMPYPFWSELMRLPNFLFIMFLLSLVYLSMFLNHRNSYLKHFIAVMSNVLGIISLLIYGVLFYDIVRFFERQSRLIISSQKEWEWLVEAMIYLIFAMFVLHFIPIITYMCCFPKRCFILLEILYSLISSLFYLPTYLIILNTYALARIDDISWGTKGLNDEVNATQKIKKQQWKKIKMMQVSKFVFWNIIITSLLMAINKATIKDDKLCNDKQSQYEKFKTIFFLVIVVILFLTIAFKSILGTIYLIKYKRSNENKLKSDSPQFSQSIIESRIQSPIWQTFDTMKRSIYHSIFENIEDHIKRKEQIEKLKREDEIPRILIQDTMKKIQKGKFKKQKDKRVKHSLSNSIIQRQELRSYVHFLRKKKQEKQKQNMLCQINEEINEGTEEIVQLPVSQFEREENPENKFKRQKSILQKKK